MTEGRVIRRPARGRGNQGDWVGWKSPSGVLTKAQQEWNEELVRKKVERKSGRKSK